MKYKNQEYEHLENTVIHDEFWNGVLEKIQDVMIPYVFEKFMRL